MTRHNPGSTSNGRCPAFSRPKSKLCVEELTAQRNKGSIFSNPRPLLPTIAHSLALRKCSGLLSIHSRDRPFRMTASVTVYQYSGCGTCRTALRWLRDHNVSFEVVDIVSAPPSPAILSKALKTSGLPIRRLFNTSGQSYRQGGFKELLPSMSTPQAIAALAQDGKLIKRPLIVGQQFALVGFKAEQYAEVF